MKCILINFYLSPLDTFFFLKCLYSYFYFKSGIIVILLYKFHSIQLPNYVTFIQTSQQLKISIFNSSSVYPIFFYPIHYIPFIFFMITHT